MSIVEIHAGDRCVHLPDVNGFHATIPNRLLPDLHRDANRRDDGRVKCGLRTFHRDVLASALALLPRCTNCHDAPAINDMGDGHQFCDPCCSAAQGSIHDDKTEF